MPGMYRLEHQHCFSCRCISKTNRGVMAFGCTLLLRNWLAHVLCTGFCCGMTSKLCSPGFRCRLALGLPAKLPAKLMSPRLLLSYLRRELKIKDGYSMVTCAKALPHNENCIAFSTPHSTQVRRRQDADSRRESRVGLACVCPCLGQAPSSEWG